MLAYEFDEKCDMRSIFGLIQRLFHPCVAPSLIGPEPTPRDVPLIRVTHLFVDMLILV